MQIVSTPAWLEIPSSRLASRPPRFFTVADGHLTSGSTLAKLHHPVQEPARTVTIVPALAEKYLPSGNKFVFSSYGAVLLH